MYTKEELEKMFNQWASNSGIAFAKEASGTITTGNTNFGDLMPATAVRDLIDLTVDQSQFLQMINVIPVTQSKGSIPIIDWSQPTLRKVDQNHPLTKGSKPDTSRADYVTQKMGGIVTFTHEDLREAAAIGIENFEGKLNALFTKQMGNDFCKTIWDGDTTLDPDLSEENAMLCAFNGVHVLTEGANVIDAHSIAAYGLGIHGVMLDKMPTPYNSDPALKWLMSRRTDSAYHRELEKLGTALGDAAKVSGQSWSPYGIPKSVVPQLRDNLGPAATPGAAIVDDTDGTMTVIVDTFFTTPGTAHAGRKVTVTYLPNGLSETLTVTWDATNNIVSTTTALGQTTISTTATDYSIQLVDETSIVLTNPKYMNLVLLDAWRASRKYNEEYDRYEIRVWLEVAFLMPILAALVKAKRVTVPIVETWSAAA